MKNNEEKEMRAIAMDYHGGHCSALYSFGSTGRIFGPEHVDLLVREIKQAIQFDASCPQQIGDLNRLQSYVVGRRLR